MTPIPGTGGGERRGRGGGAEGRGRGGGGADNATLSHKQTEDRGEELASGAFQSALIKSLKCHN